MLSRLVKWIKEQSKQPKLLILDLAIGALTVFLMIMVGFAVEEITYYHDTYDENSFYWRLQEENYPVMVGMYHSNVEEGKGDAEELQEYYGVARYFEAASYYKMYIEAGETALAEEAREEMEAAHEQMGEFSMVKEEIDAKLGLE